MNYTELTALIAAAGHRIPTQGTSLREHLKGLLELEAPGSGNRRTYTHHHANLIIAWCRITQLCTGNTPGRSQLQSHLHRQAAHLLATQHTGYVYITNRTVAHTPHPPLEALRHGATCWPV